MEKVILFGPFVGEMYWEAGRFAALLPFYKNKYKDQKIKFVVLTRQDRFDLYGKYADILVPLRIDGDYKNKFPNCYRLDGFGFSEYETIINKFRKKYDKYYQVVDHIYPKIDKKYWSNKGQFSRKLMLFDFKPRNENYELVEKFLPDDKPVVIIAPRFRDGFRRNWPRWPMFYDYLHRDKDLLKSFNFVICGVKGQYIPDPKDRFLDMNKIELGKNSSKIGLLLCLMEKAFFTFGSQSAIPNISLIYKVDVLEFGCQMELHTKTYNFMDTPITFIENKKYNILVSDVFPKFTELLRNKRTKFMKEGKWKW